eukprot:5328492-Heterocapsa_arctica.AAC.1
MGKAKAKCTAGLAAAEHASKKRPAAARDEWNSEVSAVFCSEFGGDLPCKDRFKACATEASRLRAEHMSITYGCSKCRQGRSGCKACNPAKQIVAEGRAVVAVSAAAVSPTCLAAARAAAAAAAVAASVAAAKAKAKAKAKDQ